MAPRWSVISVNFDSFEYLDYQAKVLQEFNDDYEFIICDNYTPSQENQLKELKSKYKNIQIVVNTDKTWKHGAGLNLAMKEATGKYICMIDPDFFFHKKNYLQFLESFFDQGYHAVGTEFYTPHKSFPVPWGAAYILDEIKDLDMESNFGQCEGCKKWICPFHMDTGFQIRIRLKNLPHMAFKEVPHNIPFLGNHSNEFRPRCYEHDGKIICSHLMRGKYDRNEDVNQEVKEIRKKYCEHFYQLLN